MMNAPVPEEARSIGARAGRVDGKALRAAGLRGGFSVGVKVA
jgi:hypothetical protein